MTAQSYRRKLVHFWDKEMDDLSEKLGVADSDWLDLPTELIDWLQGQNGLKIDGDAIESREDLERAFRLLCRFEKIALETRAVIDIAIDEAMGDVGSITRTRREVILQLTVTGAPGKVIERRYSTCGRRVFDDGYPRFVLRNQAVSW
ncbi:hypothetical protein BJX70DRAFT_396506 [Aspergillus crustosus]